MGACSGDAPVQLTALQKEVKDIEDKLKKETENNEMYFKGHNNKSNELMELKTRKAVVLVESGTALAQYRNYFDPSVDASGPSLQWLPVELLSIIIEQVPLHSTATISHVVANLVRSILHLT